MDFIKKLKPLGSSADWHVWKRKIRDLMDYHEGALEAIDGKITKPEPLEENATAAQQRQYKIELDYYRKANSYAKSMITASVTDRVWKDNPYITERTVDVHVARLRKKLGERAFVISNRSGYGYRFNTSYL